MIRFVELKVEDMGIWHATSPTCPANRMKAALGEKPMTCRCGISTNIQGPIPMGRCKFLEGDIFEEDNSLKIACTFQEYPCSQPS
jgi:hypothetical protein